MQIAHGLRIVREIVRNALAREALEVAPAAPPRSRGRSLARVLFEIEPLAQDPEPPGGAEPRASPLRALLAPEPLGLDPEPPASTARRAGVLRALFELEPLAEDPAAPPPPARHRWLDWLFRPEPLDPPRR
jgi:hypothetical protein